MSTLKYYVYQPTLIGNEKKYVNECLDTSWISSKGRFVNEFENEFSKYVGVKYGVAVCNGTVSVHLALLALGVSYEDEVIVSTFTYIASVNPILYVGAKPIFVDVLEGTWQMNSEEIERKITNKTKAIIVVHLYGHPCDMDKIMKIAKKYNLFVIEDCAEAIGSEFENKKVGSFGDISCFSFFGNKTITCGEGGMVLTNNLFLSEKIKSLKSQGISKSKEYWHDCIGYNYRMTNIQAAIGLAQLEQVDKFIYMKYQIAEIYQKNLKNLPVVFHRQLTKNIKHTYWMCSILCENHKVRENLREFLKNQGIETRPTFYPIHTMPIYSNFANNMKFKVADNIALRGINLPSYPTLNENDIEFICKNIEKFYKNLEE